MDGIVNIFAFCVYFGVMILCAVLIIYSTLRWIRHSKTRDKRLYILSGIAFIILLFMFSRYYMKHLEGPDGDENRNGIVKTELLSGDHYNNETFDFSMVTDGCLAITKTVVSLLIFVVVFASAVTLLSIVILCIYIGLRTIIQGKAETGKLIDNKFVYAIKQPIVILVVTLGILSFFFILPIIVGEQGGGDMIETWTDGIIRIDSLFDFNISGVEKGGTDTTDHGDNDLVTYILTYIIVLGVGLAVVKLLYAVLGHVLLKEDKLDLIDKYSSPIALLSVGVAFLLALQRGKIPAETGSQTIWELVKAFGTVVFIIAIVILTLEIIRLLIDIQQKLIRQEAKYLFIALVGQSALLVLGALNFIFSGVCSMIGSAENTDLDAVEVKLKRMIVEKMKQQMDCVDVDDDGSGHDGNYRTSFSEFDEKVTKK